MSSKTTNLSLLLAGWGILLVVFGHSDPTPPTKALALASADPAYRWFRLIIGWIYTFHMPLFFFLSGVNYLRFTARKHDSYGAFLVSKAKRLLIPYFLFTTLTFPVKAVLSRFALRPEKLSLNAYFDGLLVPWHNPIVFFWFLPTLFLVFCSAPLLKASLIRTITITLTIATAITLYLLLPEKTETWLRWLNLNGAMRAVIFFYGGMFFEHYRGEPQCRPAFAFAGVVSLAIFWFWPSLSPVRALLLSALGIIFSVGLVKCFRWQSHWLAAAGVYSFQIYLFSWFPQIAARIGAGQILHLNLWIIIILMFCFGLLVPIALTQILEKVVPRSFRFIYGA